ncbi:MAG: Cof-type HAD-IIB family hydrolase, partial [Microcystaceae cyanobacterium]
SNQVSQRVKQAIQAVQAKGIQVAIATGRMYNSALRFHTSVGSQLPLLAYNGAWIQNPVTGTIHEHLPVSQALALQLLNDFEQPELRSRLGVHFYIGDQLYVRQITSETENYAQRSGIQPIAVGDLRHVLDAELTKILVMSQDTQMIAQLTQSLQKRYLPTEVYLTQSTATFCEATNPNANKGAATCYLTEQILGLKAENVMAIGDNFNDAEMLKYAGLSIAMRDAPTALHNLTGWVAPSVENDGVAVAIEKFLL